MYSCHMAATTQTRITPKPGQQFYQSVRGGFATIGESLTAWCREKGYHQPNVRSALFGAWEGPRAQEVRAEVIAYLEERGTTLA